MNATPMTSREMPLTFRDRLGIEIVVFVLILAATIGGLLVWILWVVEGPLPARERIAEFIGEVHLVPWYVWFGPYLIHWVVRALIALLLSALRRLKGGP